MNAEQGIQVSVVCFSDEPEAFKDAPFNFHSGPSIAMGLDPNLDMAEFCAMLASDLIICGNSTFSLWAAYLSPLVRAYWVPNPWSIDGRISTTSLIGPLGAMYKSSLS